MRYDEIPQLHACGACRAKAPTAGKLLAWHANHSADVLHRAAAPKRVLVWNDMFDPYHNGNQTAAGPKSHYQHRTIAGGITGAWTGLSRSWTVANWQHSNLGVNTTSGECVRKASCQTLSLRWFESLGFSQFICGYYGSGDGNQSAATEIENARGVQGLLGMIYGPWAHTVPGDPRLGGGDYTQLERYAAASKAQWPTL